MLRKADYGALTELIDPPYLMIDSHDNDEARVVAIGLNNAVEGEGDTPCVPPANSDDNILCLPR
ncbi:hypothetical protein [Methylomarinum vadi]|uniref:hypothetical protein n=1 Tax=Methylomarinum vadi TaxID=438855 RepID=UPI00126901FD|nr:hypothetical protein [Methylomarinum vadi]